MNGPPEGERTEILFALQEELERLQANHESIDVMVLARRFGVTAAEVERSRAALAALAGLRQQTSARAAVGGAPVELSPPSLPDDYELLGEIGRGGMGVVYKVHQRSLDRVIAVKLLRPGDLLLGDLMRRFRREAQSLARLRHPHIVSVHEVGDSGGLLYFTMDFIDGEPLSELIRRGGLTPTRAVRLLCQIVSAIAYSHGHGVVHRDLKPGNVLVDRRGDAFVVDFGLARELGGAGEHTVSGQILGTPAYMSPEQARGDGAAIGERSDVYALGAILYECLTGRPPFVQKGIAELVQAVLHDEPKSPRRLRPDVPLDLELICRKAMAKEAERRYATANALLEDLERFHEGRPVRARAPSLGYRSSRFVRRHWRTLALGAALAAALVAAFVAVVLPMVRPPAAATLAAATALAELGEHRAAAVLIDRARNEVGAAQVRDELRERAVAADLALLGRELELPAPDFAVAQQLLEHATTDAIAMVGDDGRSAVVDQAWELAAKASRAGQADVRKAATDCVDRILVARAAVTDRGPDQVKLMALALGAKADPRLILARLLPALKDPDDPLHAVATDYVVERLVAKYGEQHEVVVAWLLENGEPDPLVLRPLLTTLGGLDDAQRVALMTALVGESFDGVLRRPAAMSMLASVAGSEGCGLLARTAAARLLAQKADLPLRASDTDWVAALTPAPEFVAAVVSAWGEVEGLDREAGFERRLAMALASPALEQTDMRRWLYEHTFGAPGFGTAAAWRQWWAAQAQTEPRDRLARALGMSTAERDDLPALLQRFLVANGYERAALHHLLALSVPGRADQVLPGEPFQARTPELWWRAVHGDAPTPQYEVRWASFAWSDGAREPELVWEEARVVHLFESVRLDRISELPPLPVAFGAPRVPGYDTTAEPIRGSLEQLIPALQVRWTQRGEVELVPMAMASLRLQRVNVRSMSSGMAGVRAGRVGLAVTMGVPQWADQRGGMRMLALGFGPATENAPAPWGIAGWRARVADELRGLSEDLGRDPWQGQHYQEVMDAAFAVELATKIPVPEALADLRRMDGAIASGRSASTKLADFLVRARLLLGDGELLRTAPERVQDQARVVGADASEAEADTRFWAHVLLRTIDPELQREAARRLHAEHLTSRMAAQLATLPASAREAFTDAVALRVVTATPIADAWLLPRSVALPSLVALLLGAIAVVVAAAAMVRRRRPGPFGSALLLLGGIAVLVFDISVAGLPLLPDVFGYGLLALANWAYGSRRVVPWLFVAAAATDLLGLAGLPLCRTLTTTLVAVAVVSAPFRRRQPIVPRTACIGHWLLVWPGLGAFLFGVAPGLANEWFAQIGYGMPSWSYRGEPAWIWNRQLAPLLGLSMLIVGTMLGRRMPGGGALQSHRDGHDPQGVRMAGPP